MRESCLAYLACPRCRRRLDLAIDHRDPDGHVMTGTLACGCSAYPITGGIPRFATANATAQRFAAEWKIFSHMASYQEQWLRNWLAPLAPADFRGKVVFEGGCGKGRHTTVIAGWGAKDVIALDLGDAVEVAFAHTRHLPNAHVVQGDLCAPPVVRDFDIAFSIGVLHHLRSPRAGFAALRKLVHPGGKLAVWVYGYESNEWIVKLVSPVRERITSRMPAGWLYWLSVVPSAAVHAVAKLLRRLPARDYLDVLAPLPFREVHSIVFDQLVTPIAYYLPRTEVESWFAGLTDVTIGWHNQNSWRGCATA
jgi:SAM-dependent methyltransferase